MTESLTSRIRNFIILNSGERIYPEEIEGIYTKVAPVKEMCVFTVSGMGGAGNSRVLWAVIQPDLDSFREFGEVNLRSVLKERLDNATLSLPEHKRLKGFTIALEDLPHNFFGKLERYAVKEIYEPRVIAGIEGALPVSGELKDADLRLIESELGIKILKCLEEQSGVKKPIKLEDSLELDLGIDSLGRIELALRLNQAFSVDIKLETVARSFSVKDLFLGIGDALCTASHISPEDKARLFGPGYWKENLRVLPKKETLEMIEMGTGYFAWLFRFIITAIDCSIFKLFFSIKGEGAQNVPKEGAYILYANHASFLDGPAIAACLPRRPVFQIFYFVFGPYFFRPFVKSRVLRNFVKMGRFIPFDFSTHFLEALRSCFLVLQRGKGLCFFPEGLRSSTGEIGKFKKGFGVLAKETGAQLVPVAIEGTHEAWASTAKYPKRYPVRVRFGQPLIVEELEKEGMAMGAKNSYDAICVAARKALIELKTPA
ncbi:MAG: 1-acyl-sn-glycerol-3-phosphate acyltransferase [Candidatus Omnitrophota bacterium]